MNNKKTNLNNELNILRTIFKNQNIEIDDYNLCLLLNLMKYDALINLCQQKIETEFSHYLVNFGTCRNALAKLPPLVVYYLFHENNNIYPIKKTKTHIINYTRALNALVTKTDVTLEYSKKTRKKAVQKKLNPGRELSDDKLPYSRKNDFISNNYFNKFNAFSENLELKNNKILFPLLYTDFYSFYFFDAYNYIPEKIDEISLFQSNNPFMKKYFKKISEHLNINYKNISIINASNNNTMSVDSSEIDLCMQIGTISFFKSIDNCLNNLYIKVSKGKNICLANYLFELQFINILPFINPLLRSNYPFKSNKFINLKKYIFSFTNIDLTYNTILNNQLYISRLFLFLFLSQANYYSNDEKVYHFDHSKTLYNNLLDFYNEQIFKKMFINSKKLSTLDIIKKYNDELSNNEKKLDIDIFINEIIINPLKCFEFGNIKKSDLDLYFKPISPISKLYNIEIMIKNIKKEKYKL